MGGGSKDMAGYEILGQRGFLVDPTSLPGIYDRPDFDGQSSFCDVVAVLPGGGVSHLGELSDEDGTFCATRAGLEQVQTFDDRVEALSYLAQQGGQ
jgi:hypothetical protein